MKPCNEKLTEEERARNVHGPIYLYSYTPDDLGEYQVRTSTSKLHLNLDKYVSFDYKCEVHFNFFLFLSSKGLMKRIMTLC